MAMGLSASMIDEPHERRDTPPLVNYLFFAYSVIRLTPARSFTLE